MTSTMNNKSMRAATDLRKTKGNLQVQITQQQQDQQRVFQKAGGQGMNDTKQNYMNQKALPGNKERSANMSAPVVNIDNMVI